MKCQHTNIMLIYVFFQCFEEVYMSSPKDNYVGSSYACMLKKIRFVNNIKAFLMENAYRNLTTEEYEQLKDSISLITILIAGADNNIDPKETEWAEKLARIRSYSLPDELKSFYADVGEDFHHRLHNMIDDLPDSVSGRTEIIHEKLSELNPILQKLHPSVGSILYESLLSFAKHVAKASGGFLRFFSVSSEEKELLDLAPIIPIVYSPEDL